MADYIKQIIEGNPVSQMMLAMPDDKFDKDCDRMIELLPSIFEQHSVQQNYLNNELYDKEIGNPEIEAQVLAEIVKEIDSMAEYSESKRRFLKEYFTMAAKVTRELAETNREKIKVKIVKLNPDAIIPTYAHPTDAGADVAAVEETKLEAGETKIVKTGIAVAIPAGYEIQIRPRSGLSFKSKLRVANAPGTIDAEYRGEVGIIITNTGDIPYVIDKGMKIAQMVIAPTPMIKWEEVSTVEELGSTARGKGGFGSTDKK